MRKNFKHIVFALTVGSIMMITTNSCKDAIYIEQDGILDEDALFVNVTNMNDYLIGSVYANMDINNEIYLSAVISDEVKPGSGSGGQEFQLHRYFLDNSDGRFSPLNESSPYRVGNYTGIGPLRPARITLNAGFGDVALFTGFVQSWNEKYGSYGANPTVDVSLTSVEGRIGDYTRYASASSGAGESAASRILRILSSVGWLGDTYLATGSYALQATTLEGNALQELQLVADSQGGALWFNGAGDCIFDDISSLQFRLANTFAGTVFTSDKALIESGEAFTYETIEYAYDGELTKNIAQYARVGGTVQTVTDESSRSLYGDRAISRTDLIPTTDTAVAVIAQKKIALNKGPELRVESLSLSGRAQYDQPGYFTAWQQIAGKLDLRLGCVVDLDWTPAGALDNTISRSCIIQGVTHTITRNDWNVSVEFTSGTIERAMSITQWDYFNWDEGVWSW